MDALEKLCYRFPEYADEIREVEKTQTVFFDVLTSDSDVVVLNQAFLWRNTPQGYEYWEGVSHALGLLETEVSK